MNNPCNLGMEQVPVARLWEQRQPGPQSLVPGSAAYAETCFFSWVARGAGLLTGFAHADAAAGSCPTPADAWEAQGGRGGRQPRERWAKKASRFPGGKGQVLGGSQAACQWARVISTD